MNDYALSEKKLRKALLVFVMEYAAQNQIELLPKEDAVVLYRAVTLLESLVAQAAAGCVTAPIQPEVESELSTIGEVIEKSVPTLEQTYDSYVERNQQILDMHLKGFSTSVIANEFDLTSSRINQIINELVLKIEQD